MIPHLLKKQILYSVLIMVISAVPTDDFCEFPLSYSVFLLIESTCGNAFPVHLSNQ